MYSASTQTLKEKFEADLKKEIKRLQRFRDLCKTWASNNDIKNKAPLIDARKVCPPVCELAPSVRLRFTQFCRRSL